MLCKCGFNGSSGNRDIYRSGRNRTWFPQQMLSCRAWRSKYGVKLSIYREKAFIEECLRFSEMVGLSFILEFSGRWKYSFVASVDVPGRRNPQTNTSFHCSN